MTTLARPRGASPAVLALLALTLFLVLWPLTVGKPGLPMSLKSDEPAYYLMALSLAKDGDLRVEAEDTERAFEEFPFSRIRNLILMTDDGWRSVYYGKPYVYSLFAAPAAGLFGANGMVAFNMALLAAMVWMGFLYLRRFNPAGLAALFSAGFFLLSCAFPYVFWIHPEVFNMAAVAACLFLGLHRFGTADGSLDRGGGLGLGEGSEGDATPLRLLLSGACLALVVYNKPMFAALGLAVVWSPLRYRRWGALGAWVGGFVLSLALVAGGSVLLTGHPSAYLGVKRQGVTLCEPGVVPIPASARQAMEASLAEEGTAGEGFGEQGGGEGADEELVAAPSTSSQSTGTGGAWTWLFRIPDLSPGPFFENLGYFLWGRHTGLLLYMPFALVAVGLLLARSLLRWDTHRDEGWMLLASLVIIAVYFLLWIPFNWQGGGGFVGNRYFVNAYPAFLFLVTRIVPGWIPLVGYGLGGLFLGPLLFTPFPPRQPEPTLQAHTRGAFYDAFPLELSLREVPGYQEVSIDGVRFRGRQDQLLPRGERLWVRAYDEAEIWLLSWEPLEKLAFEVKSGAPANRIRLSLAGQTEELTFEPSSSGGGTGGRRVTFTPESPTRTRTQRGVKQYAYRLEVEPETGRIHTWERQTPPNSCEYFPYEEEYLETFPLGAELLYLGDGGNVEGDLYSVRWGNFPRPERAVAGESFAMPVRLFNTSAETWTAQGAARVKLSYHWLTLAGEPAAWDGKRTELPLPVPPGGRVAVRQQIEAPARPGRYLLELDLVFEQVAWFSQRNPDAPLRWEVEVVPEGAEGDPEARTEEGAE